MYIVYNSYMLDNNDQLLCLYKHRHFNKIVNYLKQAKHKHFYVFYNRELLFDSTRVYTFRRLTNKQRRILINTFKLSFYSLKDLLLMLNSKYRRRKTIEKFFLRFISWPVDKRLKYLELKKFQGHNVNFFLNKAQSYYYKHRLHSENMGIVFLE